MEGALELQQSAYHIAADHMLGTNVLLLSAAKMHQATAVRLSHQVQCENVMNFPRYYGSCLWAPPTAHVAFASHKARHMTAVFIPRSTTVLSSFVGSSCLGDVALSMKRVK
jgi:hypothetical protein